MLTWSVLHAFETLKKNFFELKFLAIYLFESSQKLNKIILDSDEFISVGIMWAIKLFNHKLTFSTEKFFVVISKYEKFTVELRNLLATNLDFKKTVYLIVTSVASKTAIFRL